MIKVVEIIPTLGSGGAENLIRDYCRFLDKERFSIKVIVIDKKYYTPIENDLEAMGIDVIYLGNVIFAEEVKSIIKKSIRYISRFFLFRKSICEYKPDVIHIHLHVGMYFRFLPLSRLNTKLFLTVHNIEERYFSKNIGDFRKYTEYFEVSRLIRKFDMTLIALHRTMNKSLKEYFQTDKVITLNNGIYLDRFSPNKYNKQEIRSLLNINESALVVGNVGRFHIQKNQNRVLDIFKKIHEMNNDSYLILVGSGELEQTIKEAIVRLDLDDCVIMLSNRSDIPQLMKAMDVFLMPSLWEGYPLTLIEAQAMGLKCVISENINEEVILGDRVIRLSLNESDDKWVESVIYGTRFEQNRNRQEEYDIKHCIKELEKTYYEGVHEKDKHYNTGL